MKISKIEQSLDIIDDVYVLSASMRGLEKHASTHPIQQSLLDLAGLLGNNVKWALCGGLAVGLHAQPRGTQDIDILLDGDVIIDDVVRLTQSVFGHNRLRALEHKQLGVEVDLVTPEFIKVAPFIVSTAIDAAIVSVFNGVNIPVVSKEGLVALKLNRASDYDMGDIKVIMRNNPDLDLFQYNLGEKEKKIFDDIKKIKKKEENHANN